MTAITPCLWFDGQAQDAAELYASIFPDSRVDRVVPAAADTPSGPKGMPLTVEFTVRGQQFVGLNGGPDFRFNEAISFMVDCADQAEVDRYWDALAAHGGEPGPCGWIKDRFGVSWQIVPRRLLELTSDTTDPAGAERAMQAMLRMGKIEIAEIERAHAGEAATAPR